MSVFGEIFSADAVQDAVLAHLKLWMPTYLCAVDEERGLERGKTAWPRSWQVTPRFNNDLDKQLPAMLVICPGTADKPVKEENGKYRVTYTVGVAVLVKGPDQISASAIAKRYGAAIAACIVQEKGAIDPHVYSVAWEGDSYDDVLVQDGRTLSSATVHFNIGFRNVLTDHAGPGAPVFGEADPEPKQEPKEEDFEEGPIIPDEEHIHVTITPKEL